MLALGDYAIGSAIDVHFTTHASSGAPTVLTGGVISVYKTNSVTQSVAGVALTANFDSVVGLNHVRLTTSADATFYAAGCDFSIVLTAGTVDSVSVAGYVVGRFTLDRRVVETGYAERQALALILASVTGKAGVTDNGDGTFTFTYYAPDGTTARIVAAANQAAKTRTSVTLTGPS